MTASRFNADGFIAVARILAPAACADIAARVAIDAGAGGTRGLLSQHWCRELAAHLRSHPRLQDFIPPGHVAVQCTFFEKSAGRNWLVALHQDLSIPVAGRVEAAGLRGWSEKEGMQFVQAPAETLEQMIAVRVHLDSCGEDDGPLRLVPGSHAKGVLTDDQARSLRAGSGELACVAEQGAVLLMRPLLLHASSKGSGASKRRVLHFVFGPRALPHGLRWGTAV